MSELVQPLCSCGYTINFEKSEVFCTKKCERPHLKKPPPPMSADDLYGLNNLYALKQKLFYEICRLGILAIGLN